MFESWAMSAEYPILFEVDRDVLVNVAGLSPPTAVRKDKLPLWVKSSGLLLDPEMPARQLAWIRRSDGGWIALVQLTAKSANRQSQLTMDLWLPPNAFTAMPQPPSQPP